MDGNNRSSLRRGVSHSLDRPLRHDLFRPKTVARPEEYPLKPEDAERYYLYLPRNLSYCHMCADVLRQHVQRKVVLLNSKIAEVLSLPLKQPLNEAPQSDDSDGDQAAGLWLKSAMKQPLAEPTDPKYVLKKSRRTISFPSPPHRPCTKKVVRFADALGLELETVRHVIRSELPPCIPARAIRDVRKEQEESIELIPDFLNPSQTPSEFEERVRAEKVRLHSVHTIETTIYGTVCVMNLTYHKKVAVRYTVNGWKSNHDVEAAYVFQEEGSSEGNDIDKFSFTIFIDRNDFSVVHGVRNKVHFAVSYRTEDGNVFWDNNDLKNYTLTAHSVVVNSDKRNWVHFL